MREIFAGLDKYHNHGLLILRVGIGIMFVVIHGYPKVAGGIETWEGLGKPMSNFGITFAPAFWGFMATMAEFVGGMCLITGLLFRPACVLLLFTMIVAVLRNFQMGLGLASQPFELGILFLSLTLIGPGSLTLRELITKTTKPIASV